MASASPVVDPTRPAWPPVVVGVLDGRRRAVGRRARGRVLDLGSAGPPVDSYRLDGVESVTRIEPDVAAAEHLVADAARAGLPLDVVPSLDALAPSARFDTVVSVLGLAAQADLPAALSTVVASLAPDGSLLLVEPTLRPGWVGAVSTPLTAFVPAVAPFHLNRDVPSAVRAHGLTVIAIERFTMPTVIWLLRSFAQATARRITASVTPDAAGHQAVET
jgi:hypothetical protein